MNKKDENRKDYLTNVKIIEKEITKIINSDKSDSEKTLIISDIFDGYVQKNINLKKSLDKLSSSFETLKRSIKEL